MYIISCTFPLEYRWKSDEMQKVYTKHFFFFNLNIKKIYVALEKLMR